MAGHLVYHRVQQRLQVALGVRLPHGRPPLLQQLLHLRLRKVELDRLDITYVDANRVRLVLLAHLAPLVVLTRRKRAVDHT